MAGSTSEADVHTNEPAPDKPPTPDGVTKPLHVKHISGPALFIVTSSVTLVVFLITLDTSILSTAVPQITTEFHSLPDVGWYNGAYQLACASCQLMTGKLYTHFRIKWIFLASVFVFELGSLLCGLANSSPMLIVGRAVAGLGSAGLVNGGLTIISASATPEKRPLYTGIILGIAQLGIVMGPLIGGVLTEYATWRWCFFINLPIGGVAVLMLLLCHIPELTKKERFSLGLVRKVLPQLDLVGFVLFTPAIVMFLLALQLGAESSYAWNSPTIIGLLCGAGVLAIIFGFWQNRLGDKAMIPSSIIGKRIVWASAGQMVSLSVCVFVASAFLPIYFQAVKGASPTMSGVYMLPSILSQLLFSVISGAAVSKLGYYLPWAIFGSALTAVGGGLTSTLAPASETGLWVGYQILMGAGRGSTFQTSLVATQHALTPEQIPLGLAILIFSQNVSAAVFIVVATTIFSQSLVADIQLYAPSVSPSAALAAGARAEAVRNLVPAGSPEIAGVVLSFSNGIDKLFYLVAAAAISSLIFSTGIGWKDVRKPSTQSSRSETPSEPKEGEVKADV